MKAITTTYKRPGNVRGSRIVANDGDGNRVIIHYRGDHGNEWNHQQAAEALLGKMGWRGGMVGGHTKHGMCWVFIEDSPTAFAAPAVRQ